MTMTFWLLLLVVPPSFRHDDRVSASKVIVGENEVIWEIDVSRFLMEDVVRFPAGPVDLTPAQLQSVKDPIVAYLRSGIGLRINGEPAILEPGDLIPEEAPFVASGELYIYRVHQVFRARSAEPVRRVEFDLRLFADRIVGHGTVMTLDWDGALREYRRITPCSLLVTRRELHPTFWTRTGDGMLDGLRGFLTAFAGPALMLALLLGAKGAGEAARTIAAFAVATLVACLFASRGILQVTPKTSASLAAASVVYVALENYWLRDGKLRWVLAFGLGLIHGVGFGGGFAADRTEPDERGFVPLASFNLGLCLGIAAVLLVAVPLIRLAAGKGTEERQRRVIQLGSSFCAAVGAALLLEQLAGLKLIPRGAA